MSVMADFEPSVAKTGHSLKGGYHLKKALADAGWVLLEGAGVGDGQGMQVYAGQLLCGIDQGLYFLGSQESFTGISDGGNLDAANGILPCENRCSIHFREAGLSESIIYDASVLLDSRGGGTGLHQVINDSLNIFPRDDRQGFCANGRFDDFVEALLVGKPAPLGSLGFRHIVPFKEVLEGHMGNVFFRLLSLGGGTFGSGLFPHFVKALRPSAGLFVLFDSGQHLEGFFCVPLLRGPAHGEVCPDFYTTPNKYTTFRPFPSVLTDVSPQ